MRKPESRADEVNKRNSKERTKREGVDLIWIEREGLCPSDTRVDKQGSKQIGKEAREERQDKSISSKSRKQ